MALAVPCLRDNYYVSNLGVIYFHDVEHWNSHLFILNPHSKNY